MGVPLYGIREVHSSQKRQLVAPEEFDGMGKEGSEEHGGNIHRTSIGEEGNSDIQCTFF